MPAPTPYDLTSGSQSQSSSMMGSEEEQRDSHPLIGCSMDNVDEKQVLQLSNLVITWPVQVCLGDEYLAVAISLQLYELITV